MWNIGKSEEGRDMVAGRDRRRGDDQVSSTSTRRMIAQLTDPRKTTEEQAQQLLKTAKPIYYITSGMHSPENGGPEMLMELGYRLAVEETPFIQNDPQQRHHAHHAGDRSGRAREAWSTPTTSTRSCRQGRRGCR